jgi:hypothetical protein
MRKFKVTKDFPGAKTGDVLEWNESAEGYLINGPRNGPTGNGSTLILQPEILKGFVEETREPEEFWFVELDGKVVSSEQIDDHDCVTTWLRFPTKELAQAFAKWMQHSANGKVLITQSEQTSNLLDLAMVDALNSRKHD